MTYTNWKDPATECGQVGQLHAVFKDNVVIESFNWLSQDFNIQKENPKSVIAKVKAGHGGEVSKNNRRYLTEELMKAARTATGKKVDLNHNGQQIGKVHLADYENDDLEMVLEIWKEPYVTLLRNKSMDIKGWSINANYLFNECSKCHKRFPDNNSYIKHMKDDEFISNAETLPRGIVFGEYAITLVTSPETPGLETSHELMETSKGFNALCETFLKEHGYNIAETSNEPIIEPKQEPKTEDSPRIIRIKKTAEQAKETCKWLEENLPDGYHDKFSAFMKQLDEISQYREDCISENSLYRKEIQELERYNNQKKAELDLTARQQQTQVVNTDKLQETINTHQKTIDEQRKKITEYENALDKVKGSFKGHTQYNAKPSGGFLTHDPTTGKPRQ
jgi:hypothetical protein